ncbi:5-(carboxyamino)imidazole ribonucleotide synthase [Prolixibacter denitrificans]|uniref:N5-carboxyaminoimidazole ribonucleotide synthase n=1 Tax=Prolixibacter denitrificans TaxID=1541063 RepID=A0A2P8CAQ3_9BACT|nr:5-(carboxyamino)imidazole ribonucleotide synthase [Prolixibacter denitrificans]PSK82025.1 5-(carboxyamino)imidazole ribonucleotide synthase [Prolixibacter denitrificans]GET22617.1 N5-carboxyaminoimidazole ribonucleotide synthase [Prolixibacter denitrificans]
MNKSVIGIVGGGQLCLMMAQAIKSKNLPYEIIALDPSPNCPARPYLEELIIGDYKDEKKIKELAEKADQITFEIELADSIVLNNLSNNGMSVDPSPKTLQIIQDKYTQADYLARNQLPVPAFTAINQRADLERAIREMGLPLMVKARRDSYDGRGNYVVRSADDIEKVMTYFKDKPLMAQQFIPFDLEISVISARNIQGEVATFPVGENIHGTDYNILKTTIVPARVSKKVIENAERIAREAMEAFRGAGVFGIEMFVKGEEVLINEIAPRAHNTGHYSIEGCQTSQFEQHIRAITGNNLGDTGLIAESAVMHNIIGENDYSGDYEILFDGITVKGVRQIGDRAVIHHYHKALVKPNRKMGHLTVLAKPFESQEALIQRAQKLFKKIKIVRQNDRPLSEKKEEENKMFTIGR